MGKSKKKSKQQPFTNPIGARGDANKRERKAGKLRFPPFQANMIPVMAAKTQVEQFNEFMKQLSPEDPSHTTIYEALKVFSNADTFYGKSFFLLELFVRIRSYRYEDMNVVVLCANEDSESQLYKRFEHYLMKRTCLSNLATGQDTFGLMVQLGSDKTKELTLDTVVSMILVYDGLFKEYSAKRLGIFKYSTHYRPPTLNLICMDTVECHKRREFQIYSYKTALDSIFMDDLKVFYWPSTTSWCRHFHSWNTYLAKDVAKWFSDATRSYCYLFCYPQVNSELNEIYQKYFFINQERKGEHVNEAMVKLLPYTNAVINNDGMNHESKPSVLFSQAVDQFVNSFYDLDPSFKRP